MAKVKHSRLQFKKLSTLKLVLFMLTVVLLMFLAMGIFFPPIGDDSDSPPNGLSFYRRHTIEKYASISLFLFFFFFIYNFICRSLYFNGGN